MAIKILSPSAKYKVYSRSPKECLTVPDGINSLPISLFGWFQRPVQSPQRANGIADVRRFVPHFSCTPPFFSPLIPAWRDMLNHQDQLRGKLGLEGQKYLALEGDTG